MNQLVVPTSAGITVQIQAGMLAEVSTAHEMVNPIDNNPAFPRRLAVSPENGWIAMFH